MQWQKAGLRTWMQPREINLADKDAGKVLDEIDAGTAPLAFIPLMKGGGEDAIIQRWLAWRSARRTSGGERIWAWRCTSPTRRSASGRGRMG